ncbi:MAG TPA: prolyl oligopeptidase family serine peptidase [Candidatus Baltobacteraceae bacterium]|jgi:dipeptidyl aminopeptidase/acylaminoacyl peptidase|nr:prolyl oligopeptidase family serine peptidase [Candidatus Baltobacteraceae bacterium]
MIARITFALTLIFCGATFSLAHAASGTFSLQSVLGYPYPLNVVSGPDGRTIAWVLNERGVRNIFLATAPNYVPRKVTNYTSDDGQEITNLKISKDGAYLVYVRGGDHDSNWPPSFPPDPALNPIAPQMEVWSVQLTGTGKAALLGSGDAPAISPDNRRVAFLASDQSVQWALIDGSGKADRLFFDEGQDSDLQWSPNGLQLAFVSTRTDHSFIGIYRDQTTPLRFLAPSTSQDIEPRWSPDGAHIAYLRLPGNGGPPIPDFQWTITPWAIWVGEAANGTARSVWTSADTLRASFPDNFDPSLRWPSENFLTFTSSADGWPHLYAVSTGGGRARLLTPGSFMVEDTASSVNGRLLYYSANTGRQAGDYDRRHVFSVDVATGARRQLIHGATSEWSPAVTADAIAFIQASAQQPPLVSVSSPSGGTARAIDRDQLPSDFPQAELVVPRSVTFRATDGRIAHGQLFERAGGSAKKPAVIFVHGGPPRQMLTTWHYMDYYTNGYAVNQYLANHGFVVLSVNYRLGIGYGYDYAHPAHWGPTGASEYRDVLGGNAFLQRMPSVDAKRIAIWGGSYGGYLTALALARNSDRFCTGVDWHGVHDWSTTESLPDPAGRYETVDIKKERRVAWESSPDASVAKWRSPVLLVQGDDDHNVRFHQTVDLARRLQLAHVPFSELVLPNEIHGFLRYASFVQADQATVDFLSRNLNGAACDR